MKYLLTRLEAGKRLLGAALTKTGAVFAKTGVIKMVGCHFDNGLDGSPYELTIKSLLLRETRGAAEQRKGEG